MTRTEKVHFIKWARSLSNSELEKEYYDASFACLGSVAEAMYERGWDTVDIMEQEKYERDLGVKADILESICVERGIKIWEEGDG
ncbi:MAG: hypothetical protein ACI3UZ_06125 [Oscillospiraceae bacterium]